MVLGPNSANKAFGNLSRAHMKLLAQLAVTGSKLQSKLVQYSRLFFFHYCSVFLVFSHSEM